MAQKKSNKTGRRPQGHGQANQKGVRKLIRKTPRGQMLDQKDIKLIQKKRTRAI